MKPVVTRRSIEAFRNFDQNTSIIFDKSNFFPVANCAFVRRTWDMGHFKISELAHVCR